MAVSYQGVGAVTSYSGTTTAAVALPAGWQQNDIFVLVQITNTNFPVAQPAGYTLFQNFVSASGGSTFYSYRRASASESNPTSPTTTPATAVTVYAYILLFRGCILTGSPINVSAGADYTSGSTTLTFPGVTTTVANCFIYSGLGYYTASASSVSGEANANLSGITEVGDSSTFIGGTQYSGSVTFTGLAAATGATGASTATCSVATTSSPFPPSGFTFALIPAPANNNNPPRRRRPLAQYNYN